MEHLDEDHALTRCDAQVFGNDNYRGDSAGETLLGEHVCKQISTHRRIAVTSARFIIPNLVTVSKRPLKSLKTKSFRHIFGRALEASHGYPGSPEEPSSSDSWSQEQVDMDLRNMVPPHLTPEKKYEELKQLKGLLEFRMMKQQLLMDKIKIGKWKSSHTSEKHLYALAKHDLKLLTEQRENVVSQLANLKKTID